MSLQERTLVIKNFDPDKTTVDLLKELCIQTGPIKNVVLRPDHAFVEYEDVESVGYSKAMLDGIRFFGRPLVAEPKLRHEKYLKYTQSLNDYIAYDKNELEPRRIQEQQMKQMQENQVKMLTIPPLPQHLFNISQQQQQLSLAPNHIHIPEQNHMPVSIPIQAPPVYGSYPYQIQSMPQQYQQPTYQPYQHSIPPQSDFQAPLDVLRFQQIQTSPYVADPLRPPPEGRGYMPWLHNPPTMNRTRSFHQVNNNMHAQQQRRLSDKPASFTQRRR